MVILVWQVSLWQLNHGQCILPTSNVTSKPSYHYHLPEKEVVWHQVFSSIKVEPKPQSPSRNTLVRPIHRILKGGFRVLCALTETIDLSFLHPSWMLVKTSLMCISLPSYSSFYKDGYEHQLSKLL